MENTDALEMVTFPTRPVMVKWMAFTATMSTITNHQSAVREATETIMTTICVIMEACSSRLCKAASIVSNEAKVSLFKHLKIRVKPPYKSRLPSVIRLIENYSSRS